MHLKWTTKEKLPGLGLGVGLHDVDAGNQKVCLGRDKRNGYDEPGSRQEWDADSVESG